MSHSFEPIPVLSSPRLFLRSIRPGDAAAIVEISVYDGVFASSETEALAILNKINADCARGESIHWGIYLKATNEIVGSCGYYRGFSEKTGEIGYILRPAFRGRGIMTEAIKLIVDFGLNSLKLDTIVAYTEPSNLASASVLQRAGFHQVTSPNENLKFAVKSTH